MVGDQGNTSAVLTDLLVREEMTKMMYEFGRIWSDFFGFGDRFAGFSFKQHAEVSLSSYVSVERRRPVSTIKRRNAILKNAMADKHSRWQGKTWRQSTEQWKGAHSSQDVWRSKSRDARCTEVTKEMDHLKRVIHEKQRNVIMT